MAEIDIQYRARGLEDINRRLQRTAGISDRIQVDRLSAGIRSATLAIGGLTAGLTVIARRSFEAADSIQNISNQLQAAGQSASQAAGSINDIARLALSTCSL